MKELIIRKRSLLPDDLRKNTLIDRYSRRQIPKDVTLPDRTSLFYLDITIPYSETVWRNERLTDNRKLFKI